MYVLEIEHAVRDYDAWKTAFDGDIVARRQSGVRRYRIFRPVKSSNTIITHLEFESTAAAEIALASLQKLWGKLQGAVIDAPRVRIVEVLESKEA